MGWEDPPLLLLPLQRRALRCALLFCLCVALVAQCEENLGGRGYRVTTIRELSDGTGIVAHLDLIGEGSKRYGADVTQLHATARYERDSVVHVHITDATSPRWEVPQSVIPRPSMKNTISETSPPSTPTPPPPTTTEDDAWREVLAPWPHPLVLKFTVHPFGFSVTRRSDNEVLFNTLGDEFDSLVFKDQYLEISTKLPESAHLYGLGEATRAEGLRLQPNKTFTLWATDIASWFTDVPLYSSYPFIMDMRESSMAHGVLLLNSNGMDIRYEKSSVTYKVIGGVLDFYFFAGSSPLAVIDQLTHLVGRPAAFPYWVLGFHQAKFGYKDVKELEQVTRQYKNANLPMESMSADIDHMHNFKDFTLDPDTYPEEKLRHYVDNLHAHHQKFIMILDPNVKVDNTYKTYVRGSELDVFLRNGSDPESRYVAQVWPGASNIPDFLHPNAQQWWTAEVQDFHTLIPFDGLWLDMNEPANFCSGPNCYYEPNEICPDTIWKCCMVCDNNKSRLSRWDDPPYAINNFGGKRALYEKTVSLNTLHHDGTRMYDTHNIYGTTEALVTHQALKDVVTGTRPFVLSRSCFFGAGSIAAHWTGDNGATWSELENSVVAVMSSGFFGVPMVGADICGFHGDTTEELCRRWILVGAFYPFSRSHSNNLAKNQELYLWESVSKAGKKILHWRYRLLPFWYTLLYEARTTGAPYVRPLFFTFPQDRQTWSINHQFMIGEAILVSPVLKENTTSVRAYFPRGVWHDLFGVAPPIQAGDVAVWEDLATPMDAINVHVRGGSIVPLQEFAMTTTEARATPFTLIVAFERAPEHLELPSCELDREYAFGHLYVDDDSHVDMELVAGRASYVKFEATRIGTSYTLKSSVNESTYAANAGFVVDVVKVLGLRDAPQLVHVNGRAASRVGVKVNAGSNAVELTGINHPLGANMDMAWSTTSAIPEKLMFCESQFGDGSQPSIAMQNPLP